MDIRCLIVGVANGNIRGMGQWSIGGHNREGGAENVHIIPSDPLGWEDGGVGTRRGGCGWGTA